MRFSKLTEDAARALVAEVNHSDDVAVDAIVELFEGHAHQVFGFPTWVAFASTQLHPPTLTGEPRTTAANALIARMSIRSAAAALGVDESTLRRSGGVERTPTREARTARGTRIRDQVTQYRQVMAAHPTWTTKAVSEHLGIRHSEVLRRQRFSHAPGEVQNYLYGGDVSPSLVNTVLTAEFLKDEDRLVILRKYATGVITSATRVSEIIELMPQIQPHSELVLQWRSTDLAMTFEELSEAMVDIRNTRRLSQQERIRQAAETKMMVDIGFNVITWQDEYAERFDLIERTWPIIAANPYVKAKVVKRLRANAERMLALIDDQPVADEEPPHLMVIQGEVVD